MICHHVSFYCQLEMLFARDALRDFLPARRGGQALVSPSSSDVDLQDLPEEKEAGGSKRHGAIFVQRTSS